ncbi:hypothetical protein CPB84DRAFT_1769363, partial [Gymnopilus junonius]
MPNSHLHQDTTTEHRIKLKAWMSRVEVVMKSWGERLWAFTESAQLWAWARHASKILWVLCALYVFLFASNVVVIHGPKDPPSDHRLSSSSCAIINGDTTYVFSQGSDGSIIVHYGESYASDQYVSTILIPGDSVTKGTPIACILLNGYQPPIRVYYLTPAKGGHSNILSELVIDFGMTSPRPNLVLGGLFVPLNSKYLYAIADATGQPRVGFQCKDNTVC